MTVNNLNSENKIVVFTYIQDSLLYIKMNFSFCSCFLVAIILIMVSNICPEDTVRQIVCCSY